MIEYIAGTGGQLPVPAIPGATPISQPADGYSERAGTFRPDSCGGRRDQ